MFKENFKHFHRTDPKTNHRNFILMRLQRFKGNDEENHGQIPFEFLLCRQFHHGIIFQQFLFFVLTLIIGLPKRREREREREKEKEKEKEKAKVLRNYKIINQDIITFKCLSLH